MGGQICSHGRGPPGVLDEIRPYEDASSPVAYAASQLLARDAADRTSLWPGYEADAVQGADWHGHARAFECSAMLPAMYESRERSMQDSPDVCVAVHRSSGTLRRLVTVQKPTSFEHQERLRGSVRRLRSVRCDNIARVWDAFESGRALTFAMEHCAGGTVYDRILQRQYFTEQETAVLVRHMLQSIAALHAAGLAHGYCAPCSFQFVSDEPHAALKLVEFGLDLTAQQGDASHAGAAALRGTRGGVASPAFYETCRVVFCAPEVVRPLQTWGVKRSAASAGASGAGAAAAAAAPTVICDDDVLADFVDSHFDGAAGEDGFDGADPREAADAWSVGAIAFLLLCGYPPFFAPCRFAILARVQRGDYAFDPPFWSKISEEAKDLVLRLLNTSAAERMTAAQALEHPWIKNLADSSLPSGSMLSTFALNLRRFYRTSLIEVFAANSLANRLTLDEVQRFYAACREVDVPNQGFFTAKDLQQVLVKIGCAEIAEAVGMCCSKALRHPGDAYLDYAALALSVRARRELLLEEELWSCFCTFVAENGESDANAASCGKGVGAEQAVSSGQLPVARLGAFLDTPAVRRLLAREDAAGALASVASGAVANIEAAGGGGAIAAGASTPDVDFVEVISEVIRALPPLLVQLAPAEAPARMPRLTRA
eukprot:TRINITY_DN21529_c3_g1_i2.p1 TRINITY_DN21529_c3_g1~~TRINITY_DN21529_c3_g1_i2.p1  ORF type:complete len:673 (+),score=174.73 TRINITY_DN21529_c3_g1_i2:51-2021(+)